MKINIYLFLLFASIAACTPESKTDTPNVILIYADDLGYGDVSAYGQGKLPTPNIDRLAAGGLRFTQAYATSATCTPSRYALLTGQYPWRNDKAFVLPGDAPMLIDTSMITMADMFKSEGYLTAVVGKWHLGLGNGNINWNTDISETPNDLGFDYSYIMAATNDRVPTVYVKNRKVENLSPDDSLLVNYKENFEGEPTAISNPELMTKLKWQHGHNMSVHNGVPRIGFMKGGKSALWVDETMHEVFLNEAENFIDESADTPFFLYYALHEPHVPRVPNEKFVGKSGMGPRGDAILEADWCVGQLLDKLEKNGLLENTLIVFSSDNGPVLNDGYYDDAVEKLGDHTPAGQFRGGKYSLFEAGTRVPFITFWKGKIKPGISDAMLSQLDLLNSFAGIFGKDIAGKDSQNFLETLLGNSDKQRENLILESSGRLAYREDKYAYLPPNKGPAIIEHVNNETGFAMEDQLYNLENDPGEKINIAAENPEKLSLLKAAYQKITNK